LRSQFYTTQTTLTSAQKEIEGYRKRAQQEELQIAEVKMMMHQEMITKDEEIGKLRTNIKQLNDTNDDKDAELLKLKEDLESAKKHQVVLEKSLESEKASALQEMSRGKASALQALQNETEKRIAEINSNHEKEKEDLTTKLSAESERNFNQRKERNKEL